jgi:hypothetical protein
MSTKARPQRNIHAGFQPMCLQTRMDIALWPDAKLKNAIA